MQKCKNLLPAKTFLITSSDSCKKHVYAKKVTEKALPFLPLMVDMICAFIVSSLILAVSDHGPDGLSTGQIFKASFLFALCVLSAGILCRTYSSIEILKRALFVRMLSAYGLSFAMFAPLWKLITYDYTALFFPVVVINLFCFVIALSLRIVDIFGETG